MVNYLTVHAVFVSVEHAHKHSVVMNLMSVVCVVAGHVHWPTVAMPLSENARVMLKT